MNFDLRVQIPLKDLVDSLVSCGDFGRDALAAVTTPPLRTEISSTRESASLVVSPQTHGCSSANNTPVREVASSQQPAYCSIPFPRIDSPYRVQGRWRSNSATYFLRDRKAAGSPKPIPKRELSPNAPEFTPLAFAGKARCDSSSLPMASPYTECSLGQSDGVWELPGLPSPLIESMQEPTVGVIPQGPPTPPMMAQSILQRGLSNNHPQCRQM